MLVIAAALGCLAPMATAAPANDDFAAAAPLTDFPVRLVATTAGATEEPGEPWDLLRPLDEWRSVWWRWTAPVSSHVAVNACPTTNGPGDQTIAAVYTGESLASLQQEGMTTDLVGCRKSELLGMRIAFFARQGQSYLIAVQRWEPGPFELEIRRASNARMEIVGRPGGPRARVIYHAQAGVVDSVWLQLDWDPTPNTLSLRPGARGTPPVALLVNSGEGAVSLGPGCHVTRPAGYLSGDFGECALAGGMQAAGPVVHLGDRDDSVDVAYSRGGTVIIGGPGDDTIHAGGQISAGPGDDEVTARPLVSSRIAAGPGDDRITGTKRRDTVSPGPGIDVIDLRGVSTQHDGGETIDSRDGEIDYVTCYRKDRADIDALDHYPDSCGHVRRHGGPARAIPGNEPIGTLPSVSEHSLDVDCPADGPRVCSGTVTVSRAGRVFVRKRFRHRRFEPELNGQPDLTFIASPRKLRAMAGNLRVTVHSRDLGGKLRTASGVYKLRISE